MAGQRADGDVPGCTVCPEEDARTSEYHVCHVTSEDEADARQMLRWALGEGGQQQQKEELRGKESWS